MIINKKKSIKLTRRTHTFTNDDQHNLNANIPVYAQKIVLNAKEFYYYFAYEQMNKPTNRNACRLLEMCGIYCIAPLYLSYTRVTTLR